MTPPTSAAAQILTEAFNQALGDLVNVPEWAARREIFVQRAVSRLDPAMWHSLLLSEGAEIARQAVELRKRLDAMVVWRPFDMPPGENALSAAEAETVVYMVLKTPNPSIVAALQDESLGRHAMAYIEQALEGTTWGRVYATHLVHARAEVTDSDHYDFWQLMLRIANAPVRTRYKALMEAREEMTALKTRLQCLEEAFDAGKVAHRDGVGMDTCPHAPETEERRCWMAGFSGAPPPTTRVSDHKIPGIDDGDLFPVPSWDKAESVAFRLREALYGRDRTVWEKLSDESKQEWRTLVATTVVLSQQDHSIEELKSKWVVLVMDDKSCIWFAAEEDAKEWTESATAHLTIGPVEVPWFLAESKDFEAVMLRLAESAAT